MASRDINDLQPEIASAAARHKNRCLAEGIDLLIYCTLRDAREQGRLFRQGRKSVQIEKERQKLIRYNYNQLAELLNPPDPIAGSKVTNAGPGRSFHQYGLAYDCVPLVNGKCLWKTTGDAAHIWRKVGELGKSEGLEWAGDWRRFREFPHFQITSGRTIPELMQEKYQSPEATTVLTASDLSPDSESDILRAKLDEPNTKFFILASVSGSDPETLARIHSDTVLVSNLNPAVRRVFWSKDPSSLSPELKNLLWAGGAPSVGTVLSTGTGLQRQSKTFSLPEIDTLADIMVAFSWEP
jgi:peptidoglycan L-alanyl-D-glutamate endopeptidase CwlK